VEFVISMKRNDGIEWKEDESRKKKMQVRWTTSRKYNQISVY
jgi:hypothetical protein